MPVVRQRAAARRDLVEHFVYLAETAGLETAERFLTHVERDQRRPAQRFVVARLRPKRPLPPGSSGVRPCIHYQYKIMIIHADP